MGVDVAVSVTIDRPRYEVAAWTADPDHAPEWYTRIETVEWRTPRPLRLGTRVAFVAGFMGRRLAYTYEVVAWRPGEELVMRTAEGPFPMETRYTWRCAGPGRTEMVLSNRGSATGFGLLVAPFLGWAVRRQNRKDLRRLKAVLEGRGSSDGPAPT